MSIEGESEIVVRDIESIDEMGAVEELQHVVWGCADIDVVPRMLLRPACEVGGVLVGAFGGGRCVGFAFGLVGLERGALSLHSHMLAVLPKYRGREIGYRLKLAQRERALARGIRRMTWTFDPLQGRNAHLNFARLGVVSDDYRLDYYGDISTSPLHTATGTDRLWVTWQLDGERVARRVASPRGEAERAREQLEKAVALVYSSDKGGPETSAPAGVIDGARADLISIEIPADINELQRDDLDLSRRWRVATRAAFLSALGAGYVVEEFVRFSRYDRPRGAYLLRRTES
ncbi:MAG: GNAT family N-acetyltransferase [Acidobacteriota bacterium]|nr:GNAT family N-acetyltransferase [Acidobacteriota bacterium]